MKRYEQDFYGWTQEQAQLLRAGRLSELDIEHLIEEIETMGRSERRAVQSRLAVLLAHLLKWQYQAQRRSKSWDFTITEQRIKLGQLLSENPGLMPEFQVMLADAYADAVRKAAYETGITKSVFPVACPWTDAQVMDEQYYPE